MVNNIELFNYVSLDGIDSLYIMITMIIEVILFFSKR